MKAVKDEFKSGQKLILHNLMQHLQGTSSSSESNRPRVEKVPSTSPHDITAAPPVSPRHPSSEDASESPDLNLEAIQANVEADRYQSVLDLHLDVKKVLGEPSEDTNVLRTPLQDVYEASVKQVYPWFDVENPSAHFEPETPEQRLVDPPSGDHGYADSKLAKHQRALDRHALKVDPQKPFESVMKACKVIEREDRRACAFCGQRGDGKRQGAGRLIYYRQNDWLHVNCAIWSSEVFEEVDGSLQNVSQALGRAQKLPCSWCDKKGATVGCCHQYCGGNYHFECGLSDGAVYKEDKTVYCAKHQHLYRSKSDAFDFSVMRTVYVDLESDVKKKQKKPVDLRQVRCHVGSLTVQHLGCIDETWSDSDGAILPLDFECSRVFWSTLDPTRRVRYTCKIVLVKKDVETSSSEEHHFVIDHSTDFSGKMQQYEKWMKALKVEAEKATLRRSLIWPPFKIGAEFPQLKCKDLYAAESGAEGDHSVVEPAASIPKQPEEVREVPAKTTTPDSSAKKLNRAVGNVLKRTPVKTPDIGLPLDLDADHDLISSIMREADFDAEFGRKRHSTAPLLGPRADPRRKLCFDQEVVLHRTWFNQNSRKKCSEVSVQCTLPYTRTNVDIDLEWEHRGAFCDQPPSPDSDDIIYASGTTSTAGSTDVSDTEEEERPIKLVKAEEEALKTVDDTEMELLSKILSMSDEQAFELDAAATANDNISQIDGADEPEKDSAPLPNVVRIPLLPKSVREARAKEASSNPDVEIIEEPRAKVPKLPDADGDNSPKKSFTIDGILKPSDVVKKEPIEPPKIAPKPPQPSPSFTPVPGPIQAAAASQPPQVAYVQTPPTFPASFQGTPRPMQYVPFASPMLQPIGGYPAMAAMPLQGFIQPPPQQLGYVTPQGIIVNPPSPFINFGMIPNPSQPLMFNPPSHYYPGQPRPVVSPYVPPPAASKSFPAPASSTPRKIARVQPQPSTTKLSKDARHDPIKALSSMASQPMPSTSQHLSIVHQRDDKQRSVGTQAKLGAPLKILTPRPWKGLQDNDPDLGGHSRASSVEIISRSSTPKSLDPSRSQSPLTCILPPPAKPEVIRRIVTEDGIKVKTRKSKSSSIKVVFLNQKDKFKIEKLSLKDGSKSKQNVEPWVAAEALKAKVKSRSKPRLKAASMVVPLDDGKVPESQKDFVNEQECSHRTKTPPKPESWKEAEEEENPSSLVFEISSEDGYKASSKDVNALWNKVFEAVQEARVKHDMTPLPNNPLGQVGLQMLGLTHSALAFLIEQLPGAEDLQAYRFKHRTNLQSVKDVLVENPSGAARVEPFQTRNPLDMFSWLASRHRTLPSVNAAHPGDTNASDLEFQLSSKRATSLDLPMAMRFRHLAKNAKEAVGVFASGIHGRGLYCKREIQAGEMVIEYAGEEIRAVLTDKREKYYESKGIGCYMFRIDDEVVVDATMKGNAARFINHSCDVSILCVFPEKNWVIFTIFLR